MVLVDHPQEMVTGEQGVDVAAGGEVQSGLVEPVELRLYGLVEEEEHEDRGSVRRLKQVFLRSRSRLRRGRRRR